VLTQVAVTVAYAALPALVVQAVQEGETGVANAVNSIARSVGQALGSTLAVTFIAANLDPATGFPRDIAYTLVALTGAVASAVVVVVAAAGLRADRHVPPADHEARVDHEPGRTRGDGGPIRRPEPRQPQEHGRAGSGVR
jgi:hypothetical protein